ncbi:zinc finger protein GLIS3-like [Agrilus planipennis]|uniref:Zinc finger protein GLIS3-like n=1 Tax=Agrilus planipennis TaxID=224129 RepID=A0A1W4XEZ1_AGRPL|nr:zinc finger protein GLIS3-like [Agrilus planipennis]
MFHYDRRFLEGNPLRYYYYPNNYPQNQFERHFFPGLDHLDVYKETTMPLPPISPQSDSENSVCSVEVPYKELKPIRSQNTSKSDCNCHWINCGLGFESLDLLANHVSRVHAASGPGGLFYCRWEGCTRNNKGFNARYKMLVHVRTHTNEKPHRCGQCEKSFSRAENLKIHVRSHSGEKPYVCPVPGCTKAYSNSSDRFKHTRTHQVEKPYQCKVPGCPKRYTDPSSLRKHVKTYKHFVNEEKHLSENKSRNVSVIVSNIKERNNELLIKPEQRLLPITNETTVNCCNCNCTHKNCCIPVEEKDCISYEKMICTNFNAVSWNMLTSYATNKEIYKPYDLKQEEMDIDLPLDLSISARQ